MTELKSEVGGSENVPVDGCVVKSSLDQGQGVKLTVNLHPMQKAKKMRAMICPKSSSVS